MISYIVLGFLLGSWVCCGIIWICVKLRYRKINQRYIHNKTGKIYTVLLHDVIECTNGREDIRYVLYSNDQGQMFCREAGEFYQKFMLYECTKK